MVKAYAAMSTLPAHAVSRAGLVEGTVIFRDQGVCDETFQSSPLARATAMRAGYAPCCSTASLRTRNRGTDILTHLSIRRQAACCSLSAIRENKNGISTTPRSRCWAIQGRSSRRNRD
jgi:hypothetical protein